MPTDSRLPSFLSYEAFSRAAGAVIIAIGALVLLGWMFDVETLKIILPGVVSMKANTAACFVLTGIALWRLGRGRLVQACVALLLLISSLTLAEYATGWDLGIDQLLFKETPGAIATVIPGRMAPNTALSFMLLGVALLLLDHPRFQRIAQPLALLTGFIGMLGFLGFAYGITSFVGPIAYTKMALNTAVAFIVASVGLLCARPHRGMMATVTNDNVGGHMARRLLPAAIVTPVLLGWLHLLLKRSGFVAQDVETTLFAAANILIFLTILGWNAGLIFRAEKARKEADAERDRLMAELEQSRKMESVGRLAGGVAHDFNNMLSVIIGYTERATKKLEPSDPLRADLDEVLNAGFRAAEVTRQLLSYARKQPVMPKVLDLNQTLEGMLKLLQRLIGENITLKWLPQKDLWPVRVDPSQIDQTLTNLCVNARDSIDGVGNIKVETAMASLDQTWAQDHEGAVPGDFVVITVTDTGQGMDKQILSKIFEPYFTTKAVGKGTGLGLATVYGIVKQNHGFIAAQSEPGKGSTFRIYLPRWQAPITPTPVGD